MSKWGMQQAQELVSVTLQAWKEDLHMVKEERSLAALDAKMAEMLAKGDATMQKTMMKWGAQQSEQLVMITFACWKECLAMTKEERALDEMNKKMADLAAKGD